MLGDQKLENDASSSSSSTAAPARVSKREGRINGHKSGGEEGRQGIKGGDEKVSFLFILFPPSVPPSAAVRGKRREGEGYKISLLVPEGFFSSSQNGRGQNGVDEERSQN